MKATYIFGFIGGKVRLAQSLAPEDGGDPSEDKCTDGGPHTWATYVSVHKTPWDMGEGKCLECVKCQKTTNHKFQVLNTSPGAAVDLEVCQQCTACGMPIGHAWLVGENGYAAPDGRGTIPRQTPTGKCIICQGACSHPNGFVYHLVPEKMPLTTDQVPHPGVNFVAHPIASARPISRDITDPLYEGVYDYSQQEHYCPICWYPEEHDWHSVHQPGNIAMQCYTCGYLLHSK